MKRIFLRVDRIFQYVIDFLYQWISAFRVTYIVRKYGADYRIGEQQSHNLDMRTKSLGFGLIHQSIIRSMRYQKILCVGSMYGYIPYMLAQACYENKYGSVDFVDAGFGLRKNVPGHNRSFWRSDASVGHFSYLSKNKYIRIHIMTSEEFVKKYPTATWDYVYIDGDHSYIGVKKDFRLFWKRVQKNGFMVFHDITTKDNGIFTYGVRKFWKELLHSKTYHSVFFDGKCGLGMLQKVSKSD